MTEMLTKDELEVPRAAADMLNWVTRAQERISADKKLWPKLRAGKMFYKELMEESFPIALFAYRYFDASKDVIISQVIGPQKHDATVDDRRAQTSGIKFIEATASDSDYEDALRMEILSRDGHAAAAGPIRVEGSRRSRKVLEADSVTIKHDDILGQHIEKVHKAVAKKCENKYPDGTALVVRIEDVSAFKDEEGIDELDDIATSYLVPMVSCREFRVLALVGMRGAYLSYDLEVAPTDDNNKDV